MRKVAILSLALTVIGAAYGIYAYVRPSTPVSAPSHTHIQAPIKTPVQQSDAYGNMNLPSQIAIPSLGITSTVRGVGVASDGTMAIPDSLSDAGWYDKSAKPGNPGKAVIAVHTGFPNQPSKFRKLESIQPETPIQVKDSAGTTATFRVIKSEIYPADSAPLEVIFGDSPTARLNIITCTGTWNAANHTYNDRLVVYAARTE